MVSMGDQCDKSKTATAKSNSNGSWKPNLNRQLRNTRLCVYFQQTGSCKHGARCGFAHQEVDLQPAPDLEKTRMCRRANCVDPECPFAHAGEELRFTDFYFKTSLCMWHAVGKCRNGPGCRFAHGEEELRVIPGPEKPQPSNNGKAEKADNKKKKNNVKIDQAFMEQPAEVQRSEKKAKAERKPKKASQEDNATFMVNQQPQIFEPQGTTANFVPMQMQQRPQPEASNTGAAGEPCRVEPMFIQPLHMNSMFSSQMSSPSPDFSTMSHGFRAAQPATMPERPTMSATDRVDYNGLRGLLQSFHASQIAPMVEAQQFANQQAAAQSQVQQFANQQAAAQSQVQQFANQQAAAAAQSQVQQFANQQAAAQSMRHVQQQNVGAPPMLPKPKSAGSRVDPQAFQGVQQASPALVPNQSTSWEIRELAEHIKTLGEKVHMLQKCITTEPHHQKGRSETTKSGSQGSFMGMSSSQGSGGSDDASSPPGSPLPAQGRNGHQDVLHAEAVRLSWELQRIAVAQGSSMYPQH